MQIAAVKCDLVVLSLADDVTYVYDDVTYVYDDVTHVYDDVTQLLDANRRSQV